MDKDQGQASGAAGESDDRRILYRLLQIESRYDARRQVCQLEAPVGEAMAGLGGSVHGGVITYLAHSCMGHLCGALTGVAHIALGFSIQFLAPVGQGRIVVESRALRAGRKVIFVEGEVKHVAEDGTETLSAKATGTFYRPPKR